MYNKVILIGRVVADPELRYTPSGKPVVNFAIAVDRPKFGDSQERSADFINIVAWQKLAEICANYLTKGKLIAVDGRLQTRSYETNDGQKRKVYEVVASIMKMLDRPKSYNAGATAEEVASTQTASDIKSEDIEPVEISDETGAEVPF
ncbi:MAG: single-stranded DNA-binding protein [Armatimonadota bacterium]